MWQCDVDRTSDDIKELKNFFTCNSSIMVKLKVLFMKITGSSCKLYDIWGLLQIILGAGSLVNGILEEMRLAMNGKVLNALLQFGLFFCVCLRFTKVEVFKKCFCLIMQK